MPQDRFLIAPYDENSGIQRNVRPWLIPDQAFSELTNAYVFRGRVRKRFGSKWLGNTQEETRFRVNIGTTNGAGNFNGSTPQFGGLPIATPAIGQLFSIGTQVFTVIALGNPSVMLISGTATLATFDTTIGQVIINGATPATIVYYYPALPVMGLTTLEMDQVSDEEIIGFDTRFAYYYANGWERLANETTPGAARWTGSDSQFFWVANWNGANAFEKVFFVTNFNENEPNFMRTFQGYQVGVAAGTWNNFRPRIESTGTFFLNSARIIVPFKNRLVFFNTWEGAGSPGDHYPFRARWSQIGSPLAVDAFDQNIAGKGNARDCPGTEAIITVEFIKDRLIVFCERSTWEFVYTGNQADPFVWQQINTELGAESTFSIVPFDKVAIGVGNVGIHACNGSNVERIDEKIPDEVFSIHNLNAGVERVYGIRDYTVEMVYWTFPAIDADTTFPFPNRVLIYNYKTGTWAFNEDSITAFGYKQPASGITWDSTIVTWDDDVSWDSGSGQAKFRQVIAGNQEGFTFIIDPDAATNAPALQITNLTVAPGNTITITAINHNLRQGEFVLLTDIVGTGNLNLLNNKIFEVIIPITQNTFTFEYDDALGTIIAGTYAGNGVFARVSNILIRTKEYNFYVNQNMGQNIRFNKVYFLVDRTDAGQLQVDYFVSTAFNSMIADGGSLGTNTLTGTSVLETTPYPTVPLEQTATRLWHPNYLWADGECIQLKLSMTTEQMTTVIANPDGSITGPALVDFQLHAMVIYADHASSRLQ